MRILTSRAFSINGFKHAKEIVTNQVDRLKVEG